MLGGYFLFVVWPGGLLVRGQQRLDLRVPVAGFLSSTGPALPCHIFPHRDAPSPRSHPRMSRQDVAYCLGLFRGQVQPGRQARQLAFDPSRAGLFKRRGEQIGAALAGQAAPAIAPPQDSPAGPPRPSGASGATRIASGPSTGAIAPVRLVVLRLRRRSTSPRMAASSVACVRSSVLWRAIAHSRTARAAGEFAARWARPCRPRPGRRSHSL